MILDLFVYKIAVSTNPAKAALVGKPNDLSRTGVLSTNPRLFTSPISFNNASTGLAFHVSLRDNSFPYYLATFRISGFCRSSGK